MINDIKKRNDCKYIINGCSRIFAWLLKNNSKLLNTNLILEEINLK